jgi:hypothetical protein
MRKLRTLTVVLLFVAFTVGIPGQLHAAVCGGYAGTSLTKYAVVGSYPEALSLPARG